METTRVCRFSQKSHAGEETCPSLPSNSEPKNQNQKQQAGYKVVFLTPPKKTQQQKKPLGLSLEVNCSDANDRGGKSWEEQIHL